MQYLMEEREQATDVCPNEAIEKQLFSSGCLDGVK